ncbi:hypothetical protein [Mannheimia haemolytica]|uniref:Uncharacterized protein n=1 Tax=Mannheimia haemolytica TaxID=75985 RepID=A0A378NFY1_MANHA|nr:hypothetical protein [Mannheimia haemolytica]EEY09489.1 hypothetical protein COI_1903 [Mannheimia haemolytica serotype A2 str. OVINE]EEY11778.1 hypothetical protein COK_2150 [Mannheimia haemolytica serotype A2 str. BOVINE]MDW0724246.1 hypothetical protein [Mannheimia haemolytica]MDW0737423.1 hypothetical protein [Mannheimia haemolytica]TCS83867.1 hypothetical protein EDC41_14518 [Mannheimia haemolytica]
MNLQDHIYLIDKFLEGQRPETTLYTYFKNQDAETQHNFVVALIGKVVSTQKLYQHELSK